MVLSLTGNVTITFPDAPSGISIDQSGWRTQAQTSLHGITDGLRISGIGGDSPPSIGATYGHAFVQTELRFTPPNTMSYLGQATVNHDIQCDQTPARVQGTPGFRLDVTVTPHSADDPAPTDEQSWVNQNSRALAAVGVVALAIVALALAPETGGGSLVLLAAG